MRDQIAILQKLRLLDDGIQERRKAIRTLEADVQRKTMEETMVREAYEREKSKLKNAETRHREAELEVKSCRQRKTHFETQLQAVKTNVEYQALLRETAAMEKQAREWEDKILEAMEEEENAGENIGKMKKQVTEISKVAKAERDRLEQARLKAETEVDELNNQRAALVGRLSAAVRSRYERLRENKGDTAVVTVMSGSCGGCHYQLPPQAANEVRQGGRLIICEGCGRILVPSREVAEPAE